MPRLLDRLRARLPAPPPPEPGDTPFRLYPFEWLALGMALAAFAFLRWNGLHYGWNTVEYIFPPQFGALKRLLVIGLTLHLIESLLTRSLRTYVAAIVRWRWIFDWVRVWLGVMLFIYTYVWLKISVPLVRTALYDQELWKLDRWLHLGLSPNVFAIELFAGTPLARGVDWWYGFWVTSMAFITGYFVAMADSRRRRNFAFGFILLWTVGAWGYVAFPALGPCYASRDVLDPIRAEIPIAIVTQDTLWSQYLQMIKARTGLLRSFRPEFGVAAMPSLHVAAHAFFFFWCRRHLRWLQTPFAIATLFTLVGSVVTAWHYAVDGYVGILLAWLAVVAADRFDPVPPPSPASAPAPDESVTLEESRAEVESEAPPATLAHDFPRMTGGTPPAPSSFGARLVRLARPFALELFALAAVAAVVTLLRAKGLRMGWQAFAFTVPPMLGSLPRILGAGIAIHVVLAALAARGGERGGWLGGVRDYLVRFLRPASLVSWLRICAAFMLVTFAYAWLKVCIPLVHPRLFDGELWTAERFIHLGFAPNIFAVELFGGTGILPLLDLWYSFWIQTVFLAWAWAAAHPDLATRRRFVLACALLSIVGPWLYLSVPALGPCYASPEIFADAAAEMPHAGRTQAALAANYAKLVAGRDGTLRQFNPYLGIAAMPSLHVGAHWLFALWARRFARRLFPWLAIATALTFVGAIATGWHYAIDGYAGMLLAWGVFTIALRIEPPPAEKREVPEREPLAAERAAERAFL